MKDGVVVTVQFVTLVLRAPTKTTKARFRVQNVHSTHFLLWFNQRQTRVNHALATLHHQRQATLPITVVVMRDGLDPTGLRVRNAPSILSNLTLDHKLAAHATSRHRHNLLQLPPRTVCAMQDILDRHHLEPLRTFLKYHKGRLCRLWLPVVLVAEFWQPLIPWRRMLWRKQSAHYLVFVT